jgi:ATP-dependent DNA helicase RecQ
MLVGKNVKAVKRWGLDKLSTFGLLSDFDEDEVVLLIESLIATGWLEQEEFERFKPVIRLSAAGREVMIGEREASCAWRVPAQLLAKLQGLPAKSDNGKRKRSRKRLETAEPELEHDPAPVDPDLPIDRDLFKKLKTARDRWAIESQLPAYMVLSNSALEGISRARPGTIDDMLKIKGLGPAKIAKYGERLLQLVTGQDATVRLEPTTKRVRAPSEIELPGSRPPRVSGSAPAGRRIDDEATKLVRADLGPPSYYWTWRLLDRGFTQSECALIRDLDEDSVLDHAIRAACEGRYVPLNAFLPDDLIDQLDTLAQSDATLNQQLVSGGLPDGVTARLVELYVCSRGRRDLAQDTELLPRPVQ